EMLEAERQWLPQFGGESPRATPTIAIPQGTVGVDVPLDPALAIVHRFGKLAEQATE
ncbi:MAG: alpha-glucosidase/alpha-galactosidase, partial [Armatimonadetes bacterium]|nr:alpha-glucosidase/alpha-galactosidase [Armatimonadota bacterium]